MKTIIKTMETIRNIENHNITNENHEKTNENHNQNNGNHKKL